MNNKGVSAVIGLILMVAITVAIACTVYVYVSDRLNNNLPNEIITGKIIYIPISDNWKTHDVLILQNLTVYRLYCISHSDYQLLKFAFNQNLTVYFETYYVYNSNDIGIVENSVNIINC